MQTQKKKALHKQNSPNYKELERRGLIKKGKISPEEVVGAVEAAAEELSAATLLLSNNYPTQAFRLAVESMIMSATALVYKEGYRLRSPRAMVALVHFSETYLGPGNIDIVNRLDYFRQHRNIRAFYIMGNIDPRVQPELAEESIETAERLLLLTTKELRLQIPAGANTVGAPNDPTTR
jgi:uncharacterized protein (UPF0332 family)